MLHSIKPDQIGGGFVRRAFRDGERYLKANTPLLELTPNPG